MSLVREYFQFLRQSRKMWMFPVAALVLVLGSLLLLTNSTAVSAFIYTLF